MREKLAIAAGIFLAWAFVCAMIGVLCLIEAPFHLAFGWIWFFWRSVRLATLSPAAVVSAVAALALLAVLLDRFALWLYRETTGQDWRRPWTAAAVALLFLAFASGGAMIGIIHQVGWMVRDPSTLIHNTQVEFARFEVSQILGEGNWSMTTRALRHRLRQGLTYSSPEDFHFVVIGEESVPPRMVLLVNKKNSDRESDRIMIITPKVQGSVSASKLTGLLEGHVPSESEIEL